MFIETQIPSSRQRDWELDRINENREYLQNGEGTRWVLVDGVYRWLSNDNPILRLGRDLGMGVINALPGLRRGMIREAAGLTGDLPDLMKP